MIAEEWIVLAVLMLASGYLAWRAYRGWRGLRKGSCMGCQLSRPYSATVTPSKSSRESRPSASDR